MTTLKKLRREMILAEIQEQDNQIQGLIHEIRNHILADMERYHLDLAFDVLSLSSYMRAYDQSPDVVVIHYRKSGTRLYLPQWKKEEVFIEDVGGAHDSLNSRNGSDIKTAIYLLKPTTISGSMCKRYALVYESATYVYWDSPVREFVESCDSPDFDYNKALEVFQNVPV